MGGPVAVEEGKVLGAVLVGAVGAVLGPAAGGASGRAGLIGALCGAGKGGGCDVRGECHCRQALWRQNKQVR